MGTQIILKKGERLFIKSSSGTFLIKAKRNILEHEHRIDNLFKSDLFENVAIFEGIKVDTFPAHRVVNISIYFNYHKLCIDKVNVSYRHYKGFNDYIECYLFNIRKKHIIELQKQYFLSKIDKIKFSDADKIPIQAIRDFSKNLSKLDI